MLRHEFEVGGISSGQEMEIPLEALKIITPVLDKLVKEQHINVEVANRIITTRQVPIDLTTLLGLTTHDKTVTGKNHLDHLGSVGTGCLQQNQMYSLSVSPLSLPNSTNTSNPQVSATTAVGSAISGPLMQQHQQLLPQNLMSLHSKQLLFSSGGPCQQNQPLNFTGARLGNHSASSSGCQSPIFSSFNCSSPNPYIHAVGNQCGSSSPLHQITKGISYLTTGGGGSITRGTSAACEIATATQTAVNLPLDLSMDVCAPEDLETPHGSITPQNWFVPNASYYDAKPLNLAPNQPVRVVPTPPASPNLCIIQEENPVGQLCHLISNSTPFSGGIHSGDDITSPGQQHSHPQIFLTDVQGSEITLVALSSENSRDSDCDSVEHNTLPLISLQGLIITEPSGDMPSITRGIGRKVSLETENQQNAVGPASTSTNQTNDRRGSDKSLGFSDDSLSNDSNNLSPCQEPSASSGFKSDSHSEIGDHTEGHLTPDSMCDSRRMSEEMCYEVPLPYECSNLDTTRILEMVKQKIDSTMPPKGCVLNKFDEAGTTPFVGIPTEGRLSIGSTCTSDSYPHSMDTASTTSSNSPIATTNLSLEYSGGLQIEVQVCEGRSRDNQSTGKGIKLRRISGDQFEYGKLCQQLISQLSVQQVAG